MQLSNTSTKILSVLFSNPNDSFFINELIRYTRSFPNSVYISLKTLEKQGIVVSHHDGRFKFFKINNDYEHLSELKKIIDKGSGKLSGKKLGWIKLVNREGAYAFNMSVCISNRDKLGGIYGINVPTYWYNNLTSGLYYIQDEINDLGKKISDLLENNPDFARKDIDSCRQAARNLIEVSHTIFKTNLKDKTNIQLYKILECFYSSYLNIFPFLTTPFAIERYFEKKIRSILSDEKVLEVLLSPMYMRNEEMESILKIASYAKEKGFDKHYDRLLSSHWENFCWLPLFSLKAKILPREYFAEEVKNILGKKDPKKELLRMRSEEKEKIKIVKKTLEKINASNILKNQVNFLQEYMYLRTFRKNAISKAHYYHLPLLYEIAYRMKITQDDIKYLSYEEIFNWLLYGYGEKFGFSLEELKAIINQRSSGWAVLRWRGRIKTICGAKNIIETMEQYHIVHMSSPQQRVITGTVASRGKVHGRVKIVGNIKELNKVEKGDILVAKMTTPDYMIAINKAAAIVTDEGGVTCHAAIVSREFNIPCITGTRIATKTLSDNDLVEVDAFEGKVRILETITAPEDVKILSGKTIYKGKVRGIARIVLDSSDFPKIKSGDILITSQTTPEYLSLLYRVNGFVVDEDSLTSHAVAYGKALRIPSLMGTQYARNIIHDGEQIELDATLGLVKRLNINEKNNN